MVGSMELPLWYETVDKLFGVWKLYLKREPWYWNRKLGGETCSS